MDILSELNYKSQLYKLNLIRKERDIFNNPVSSNDWDQLAKAMEEDVHKEEEFVFVHPTSNSTEYSRRYIQCPINGNTVFFCGQDERTRRFCHRENHAPLSVLQIAVSGNRRL